MDQTLGVVCTLLFTATFGTGASHDNPPRVLLTDMKTLTLQLGHYTSGRRSDPVPQLKCVGGSAQGLYTPHMVQCYNRGTDGNDVQWECKADLDKSYRFGSVEVTCEGYAYPDDPYILEGSCGLEYTLELTEEGMKCHRYQSNYDGSQTWGWKEKIKSKMGDPLFIGLFIGGVFLVIYIIYKSCLDPNARKKRKDAQRPHADDMSSDYWPNDDSDSGKATSYESSSSDGWGSSSGGGDTTACSGTYTASEFGGTTRR